MTDVSRVFLDASGQPVDAARLPFDSLCLAKGVFETILFVQGQPAFAGEHEARLLASCEALSITTRQQARTMMRAAICACSRRPVARLRARVSVFGGAGSEGPAAVVSFSQAPPPPASVRLGVSRIRRSAEDPLACHKTAAYLANLLIRRTAQNEGGYDDIILDTRANVAETSTANMFLAIDGALATPSLGCILPGIVRGWVLDTAESNAIRMTQREIGEKELGACDAGFVTNSIIGLVGVSEIAGRRLVDATEFPWFNTLCAAYDKAINAPCDYPKP
jgi:branched-subunit amino acid aminotransferase/4-amino-4-deoxychorismate lyase